MFLRLQCFSSAVPTVVFLLLMSPHSPAAGASKENVAAKPVCTFYVSTEGDDSWSGLLASPNVEKTDGPVASLNRAVELVRDLKSTAPVRVLLRGGSYRIERPIVFRAEHSGTKDAPIIYAAYPGEKPIISGGRPITGWKKTNGPLWTATIEAVKRGDWYFRELFVDGRRAMPARTPNGDWFRTDGFIFDGKEKKPWNGAGKEGKSKTAIVYQGDDIRPWPDINDAVFVVYHAWTTSRHRVESLDTENRIVHFTAPSNWPMGNWEKKRTVLCRGHT